MGCVVNGPGEAAHADIALAGGGKGVVLVYVGGLSVCKITADKAVEFMVNLVREAVRLKQSDGNWIQLLQSKYKNR